jgi:hypothetical protein
VTVKDPEEVPEQAALQRPLNPAERASPNRTGAARSKFWTFRNRGAPSTQFVVFDIENGGGVFRLAFTSIAGRAAQ